MSENYIRFFQDTDQTIFNSFGKIPPLELKIIGFTALCLSGLPDRGTKDVDMLEVNAIAGSTKSKVITLISKEFGMKSPGLYRHGMYLDIVFPGIVWLPPNAAFKPYKKFKDIRISLLDPTDVCVSKVFSYCKSKVKRGNDKKDIMDCLDKNLITCNRLVRRVEEALSMHEIQPEAPDVYPQVIRFMNEEIIPLSDSPNTVLNYEVPSWMENM